MLLPVNTLRQPLQQSEGYYDIRDRLAERLVLTDAVTEGVQEGYKFTGKFSLCVRVGAWLALASYPCPNAGFFRVWTERQRGPGVKSDPPGRAHSRFNIIIRPFD